MRRFSLIGLSLASAAALYFTSGSALAIGLGLLFILCGIFSERFHISPRVVGAVAVAAIAATFLVPIDPPRANGFLFLPPVGFSGGIFSSLGTALLMLRKTSEEWERSLVLATVTATMLAAGNTTSTFPYAYTVVLYSIFLILYVRSERSKPRLSTALTSLLALAMAAGFALALSSGQAGFRTFLTSFQFWSSSINFGDTAGIHSQGGPGGEGIVMRVFSDHPELYTACRRYVDYHDNIWKALEGKDAAPNSSRYYPRGPVASGWAPSAEDKVEITTLKPEALPLPLSARVVDAPLERVQVNDAGDLLVRAAGDRFTGSYSFARGTRMPATAEEDSELLARCRQVEVDPYVAELAKRVAGNGPDKTRVAALVDFFHKNFTYGFGYPFDKAEDPVLTFLKERPAAHCEVYATCLTLMCRSVGVPARYVQGFVVREQNGLGGYWVSRERDAHAWTEVYLEGIGWVEVDATPPTVTEKTESDSTWEEMLDVAKRLFQRAWAAIVQGPRTLMEFLMGLIQDHLALTSGLMALGLFWMYRERLRRLFADRKPVPRETLNPLIARMHEMLEEFQEATGQPKPADWTLLEWADSVEHGDDFLREYSRLRYSSTLPPEEDLKSLEALLKSATVEAVQAKGRQSSQRS